MVEQIIALWPLIGMMLVTGVAAGLLAGLLGIGGGIVVVPVMEFSLGLMGVDPAIRMHVAVATSLAIIIPTSLSSTRAHHRRASVDFRLIRRWSGPIFLGSALGVWVAAQLDSAALAGIFGVVALLVALKMVLPLDKMTLTKDVPDQIWSASVPTFIGFISSMIGIGGGTLTVPALTLFNQPVHRAVGTAAMFGLLISLPATLGYMLTGWDVVGLPAGSIGYVNLIGFVIIAPVTVWVAPWGARIAHAMSHRTLSLLFGLFLCVVGIRMLSRASGVGFF